ncbi:MAG: hypothetical protein Q8P58_01770, partial [Candidatus Adlerbacteria bacterium]|nr:hypothetical protein [Candidatus Adlerbacteria bacterium]
MQRPRALLFFVAGLVWMAIPLIAAAQLVPCGTDATGGALSCDLCSLGRLMQNIINYLILYVSIPLAAAMFAYAGFLYVTGAANPTQISKAHSIFKRVLIGFLIAISAWLVVQTILNAVFDKDGFFDSGGDWFTLSCVSDLGPDAGQRLTDKNFGDLINEIIPQAPPPPSSIFVSTIDNTPYRVSCEYGWVLQEDGFCHNSQGDIMQPQAVVVGQCSTEAMGAFGANAATMSRIAAAESSCNPLACGDNGFSCGLLQINMTANNVICSDKTLP